MPIPPSPLAAGRPDVQHLLEALRRRRERTRADRALALRLRAVFDQPGAPSSQGLQFYVFEGAVSVYGAVASCAERDDVLQALASLPGTTRIADHLTVLS